jgi:hypothetical protein
MKRTDELVSLGKSSVLHLLTSGLLSLVNNAQFEDEGFGWPVSKPRPGDFLRLHQFGSQALFSRTKLSFTRMNSQDDQF